jgi:hypothetical protein
MGFLGCLAEDPRKEWRYENSFGDALIIEKKGDIGYLHLGHVAYSMTLCSDSEKYFCFLGESVAFAIPVDPPPLDTEIKIGNYSFRVNLQLGASGAHEYKITYLRAEKMHSFSFTYNGGLRSMCFSENAAACSDNSVSFYRVKGEALGFPY